jgi:hypothetical protein
MSIFSCFDGVIGISRKADLCTSTGAYTSDSGLYIDELQGMSLRILNSTGGNASLLEKMEAARENAINAFKVDVMAEILKTKEPARPRFIGDIGGKSFSSKMEADTYHGLRMYSDVIGGSYTLRGVSLILDVTEAVNLLIYDEYSLLHTVALTSQAGQPKYNSITPIQLTLEGNYYFLYQTTGQPYNNKLTCNCGGVKWCFDPEHPCYKVSRDKWTEWSMVAGVHGSDLSIRDDWSMSREARGMILHGDFGCDILGILCSEHSDWSGNQVDAAMAWAIVYKAGSFLSAYIMDSEEVNRYTLLGVEGLAANIQFYEQKYKEMNEFIAANIEEDRNECLKCRSPHGYKRMTQML